MLLLDDFGEVSAIAELSDDAGVRLERNDLMEFDDVLLVGQRPQSVDLIGEQRLMHLSLHVLHVNQLQCDGLSCRVIAAPVDHTGVALTNDVLGDVGVLTDLATHLWKVL